MNDITFRVGETVPLTIEGDDDAATVELWYAEDSVTNTLLKSATFTAGLADLTLSDTDTDIAVGEYEYMLKVIYDDASVEKYPDASRCDGCALPLLKVCKKLDVEV